MKTLTNRPWLTSIIGVTVIAVVAELVRARIAIHAAYETPPSAIFRAGRSWER